MVVSANRFLAEEIQLHTLLQPESPVLIYCSRRCTEADTGAVFAQVRMVNRSNRTITAVMLQIEGLHTDGSVLYTLQDIILADCNAAPHSLFGEERMIVLQRDAVASLRITVERIAFSDGTSWRKLPEQKLLTAEQAGWRACPCGMPNPAENTVCDLCGAELPEIEETVVTPLPKTESLKPEDVRIPDEYPPTQVIREYYPVTVYETEEEEPEAPKWLVILLSVLGSLALAAAIGFFIYCLVYFM
ncbi:MAG: hypothetical protein IJJ99_06290 [Oscillospiraceae bacterium]|nr:hypothetical protein [Oscillospiraceae bacterium]